MVRGESDLRNAKVKSSGSGLMVMAAPRMMRMVGAPSVFNLRANLGAGALNGNVFKPLISEGLRWREEHRSAAFPAETEASGSPEEPVKQE
uniref:Uncharacterized protein n=1 Tax=Physcomitrium patens TaxID=3218 RepID=A0A2K1KG66_PHYPA|nr:hypothetical protein PHYPA_009151 [Physcomitrium patens]